MIHYGELDTLSFKCNIDLGIRRYLNLYALLTTVLI